MDMTILFYFLIGAAIVFAFAVNYFNQPGYKSADDQTDIKVSDSEGHSAIGNIIRVRRNYLHIHFPDKKAWGLVQNNLEIPAYA